MRNHFNESVVLRTMMIIDLLLLMAFVTVVGISCQSLTPAPAPQISSPGLPEAPASGKSPSPTLESWSADGVIGNREYLSEITYDSYELYWVNDAEFIYVAMKAKTTGWVSLGIQPGSRMKDADMIFGFIKDGEVNVLDLFSTGDFGPHSPDTELGGTFDIIDFGGKESDGYTIIEFKRALDTGDQYDKKLPIGENKIIWAYGSTDAPTPKHINRGYGEITITG